MEQKTLYNNNAIQVAGLLFFLICAVPAHGAVYADASVEYMHIKIEGTRLHPLNGGFKLGAHLNRELAIEARYTSSLQDDNVNDLKLAVSENKAIYARFQNPDTYNGIVIYLLAGYSWTTIETSGVFAIPEQEFESFSWGFGLEEHMKTFKKMSYSFQYSHYYDHDDLMIEGYSLGLRYDF